MAYQMTLLPVTLS